MAKSEINVRQGTIEEAVSLSLQIPGFENSAREKNYNSRLEGRDHLILNAEMGKPCGFKVGDDREGDGSFNTWMGRVLPAYRRRGIAQALADEMEK